MFQEALFQERQRVRIRGDESFHRPEFIITRVEGQYDPGSVCWAYYLEGVGWFAEYELEAA